jgi:Carboxypeptidase regulatory-like domain/Photosynthesis system II assembly factor YCF48/Putative zinc-finger
MDPVRKIVSGRLRVQTAGPHPDANVLSAFAERALRETERAQVLAHLSECTDCRRIVFFALPDSAQTQKVLVAKDGLATRFALRWGTLVAVIAAAAILVVSTRHHDAVSVYKQAAPVKELGQMAAQLKTPADVGEMHARRAERENKTSAVLEYSEKKAIPAPKHMTAKPAGKFDFDQSGQVRMAPRSEDAELDKLQADSRSFGTLSKPEATPQPAAPAASPQPIGGLIETNGRSAYSATGQAQAAPAKIAMVQGNVGGTLFDPSGAVIPNATISITGPGNSRIARSDPAGKFSFDHLAPGSYTVKAEAPGFKVIEVQQVAVLVNKDSNLRLTLEPGTAAEAVEASAAATPNSISPSEASNAEIEVTSTVPAVESTTAAVRQSAKQTNAVARQKSAAQNSVSLGTAAQLSSLPQWTLSAKGTVQRSFDAGRTWQTVALTEAAFRSLCSVGTHVWVGGRAGALYHSADSGLTWTRLTPVSSGRKLGGDINQVNFSDPLNGEVGTTNSELWTTSDGGQTWNVQYRF